MFNIHGKKLVTGLPIPKKFSPNLSEEQAEALRTSTIAPPLTSQRLSVIVQPPAGCQNSYAKVVKLASEREEREEEKANNGAASKLVGTKESTPAGGLEQATKDEKPRQEVPMKVVKYNLSNDNKRDCWESEIAVPADTSKVKVGKAFERTLWMYLGENGTDHRDTLEKFRQACRIREPQQGVAAEIFRLVAFRHSLFGDTLSGSRDFDQDQ